MVLSLEKVAFFGARKTIKRDKCQQRYESLMLFIILRKVVNCLVFCIYTVNGEWFLPTQICLRMLSHALITSARVCMSGFTLNKLCINFN